MAYDPDAPPPKPSTAPSWVFLGFVLGALCVIAFDARKKPEPPPAPVPAGKPQPAPEPKPGRFDEVQTVFSAYSQYAVWQDERTQICVYDPDQAKFAECYEVLRSGDQLYYRSIPALTWPVLTHGVPENSPIEFAEPPESRAQWLKEVHDENWRDFTKGVREGLNAGQATPPKPTPVPVPKNTEKPPVVPEDQAYIGSKKG